MEHLDLDGEFVRDAVERLAGVRLRCSPDLEQDRARLDDRGPVRDIALALAHAGLFRLGRDGLVREDPDEQAAAGPVQSAGRGHAGMINLIGQIPDAARSLEIGTLHDYGKSPRPGRKLGHITVVADTAAQRDALVEKIDNSVT